MARSAGKPAPGRDRVGRAQPPARPVGKNATQMQERHAGTRAQVAFYGCNNRVVRVGMKKATERLNFRKRPKTVLLKRCPGCGEEHQVDLMWRSQVPADRGKAPEAWV